MANEQDALHKNADGVRLHQKGDYDGALKAFGEAIAIEPDHANIYRNRAETYRAMNRTDEADTDSAKADAIVTESTEAELAAHSKTIFQRLLSLLTRD